jgi:DNA-binding Lrp family transcriptional regulator
MLRIAREKLDAADRALSYFIATAREHDLPWADISHEVGISEVTCRKRANDYQAGGPA